MTVFCLLIHFIQHEHAHEEAGEYNRIAYETQHPLFSVG